VSASTQQRRAGGGADRTVFIVGMPRSGTTLTEQILASHSQVAAGGELAFLNSILLSSPHLAAPFRPDIFRMPDYSRIGQVTSSELRSLADSYIGAITPLRRGKRHLTDKMPHNFIHVGMIYLLFPNCRIIHCQRNPMDNCLSLYMQNFKVMHPYSYSLEEIGRYYAGYRALMDHWQKLLPGFIHTIGYERLVTNPEEQIRKLLEFCHLPWEDCCLEFHRLDRFVRTASEGQVDRPLYRSAIHRWRRYEDHLQPLARILREAGLQD
jgi:hypothetical protein